MVDYQKRTQSGTDRDGNPTYTVTDANYKQKRKRRKVSKKRRKGAARKTTANPLLMLGG